MFRIILFTLLFLTQASFTSGHAQKTTQQPALPAHHSSHEKAEEESCSRCDGETPCRACTNCSRCKWCNGGGTCGVCAPSSSAGSSRGTGRTASYSPATTYTTPAPTPRPRPTPDPNAFHALTPQKTVIVVPEVGLRKTAKDDSKRLRLLHKGDAVTVLGAEAGRYKIMLGDGSIGFVPKRAVGWVEGL